MDKYNDWEHTLHCNLHFSPDGQVVFSCFNCGKEEIVTIQRSEKHTKESALKEYEENVKILNLHKKQEVKN